MRTFGRGAGEPAIGSLYSKGCLHLDRARTARSVGDINEARRQYDAARCAFNESRSMGTGSKLRETEAELAALDTEPQTLRTGEAR